MCITVCPEAGNGLYQINIPILYPHRFHCQSTIGIPAQAIWKQQMKHMSTLQAVATSEESSTLRDKKNPLLSSPEIIPSHCSPPLQCFVLCSPLFSNDHLLKFALLSLLYAQSCACQPYQHLFLHYCLPDALSHCFRTELDVCQYTAIPKHTSTN